MTLFERVILERRAGKRRSEDPENHPELWQHVNTLADPSSHPDHVRSSTAAIHREYAAAAGKGSRIAHHLAFKPHTPEAATDSNQRMVSGVLSRENPRKSRNSLRDVASRYQQAVRSGKVEHHPRVFAGFVKNASLQSTRRDLERESERNKFRYKATQELHRRRRQKPAPTSDASDPSAKLARKEKLAGVRNELRNHVDREVPERHRAMIHDYLDHKLAGTYLNAATAKARGDESAMTLKRLAKKHGVSHTTASNHINSFHRSAAENPKLRRLHNEWVRLPATLVCLYEMQNPADRLGLSLLGDIFGAVG